MTTVPGFLTKAYEIFSNPEFIDCCGWGQGGETVVVKKIEPFSKNVLPRYFKHSNFQSFVRQLNMYDFHKTIQDPNHGEFKHQNFIRGRPDLLIHIKRKAHVKVGSLDPKKPPGAITDSKKMSEFDDEDDLLFSNSIVPYSATNPPQQPFYSDKLSVTPEELDVVVSEMNQQQAIRGSFEKRLLALEAKCQVAHEENDMLKHLVLESRQNQARMQDKMTKVLRCIVDMFNDSSTQLPPALLRSAGALLMDLEQMKRQTPVGPLLLTDAGTSAGTAAGVSMAGTGSSLGSPYPDYTNNSNSNGNSNGNGNGIMRGISFESVSDRPPASNDWHLKTMSSFDAAVQNVSFDTSDSAAEGKMEPIQQSGYSSSLMRPPRYTGGGALSRQNSIVEAASAGLPAAIAMLDPTDDCGLTRGNSIESWGVRSNSDLAVPSSLAYQSTISYANSNGSNSNSSHSNSSHSSDGLLSPPSSSAASTVSPLIETQLSGTKRPRPEDASMDSAAASAASVELDPLGPIDDSLTPNTLTALARQEGVTLNRIDSLEYALGNLFDKPLPLDDCSSLEEFN